MTSPKDKKAEAEPDKPTHVSLETKGYPPMLVAALNDPMPKYPEPNPRSFDKIGIDEIKTILTWIQARLNSTLDDVWNTPHGNPDKAFDPSNPEEKWARAISEHLFAIKYNGPGQSYFGNAAYDQYIFARILPTFQGEPQYNNKGDAIIVDYYKLDLGPNQVGTNTDPAMSLVAACQHVATYGVFSRGYAWLGGPKNYPLQALAASRFTQGNRLFTGAGSWNPKDLKPKNPWTKDDQKPIVALVDVSEATKLSGFGPGSVYAISPDQWMSALPEPLYRLPDDTTASPPQPTTPGGEVKPDRYEYWTWGNLGKIESSRAPLLLQYIRDSIAAKAKQGASKEKAPAPKIDPVEYHIFLLHERANAGNKGNHESNKVWQPSALTKPSRNDRALDVALIGQMSKDEKALINYENPNDDMCVSERLVANAKVAAPFYVSIPVNGEQRPGAHIFFVLRKSSDGARVQVANTTLALQYNAPDNALERASLFGSDLTWICDNAFVNSVPASLDTCVGLGIPDPTLTNVGLGADTVAKARPVGVMRLMLRRRTREKGDDGLLFVGPLLPMWGPSPTQNYTLAKLVWSLRDLPGRADVEAYWVVYHPTGALARELWRSGSRGVQAPKIWEWEPVKIPNRPTASPIVPIRGIFNTATGQCRIVGLGPENERDRDHFLSSLRARAWSSTEVLRKLGDPIAVPLFDPSVENKPTVPASEAKDAPEPSSGEVSGHTDLLKSVSGSLKL